MGKVRLAFGFALASVLCALPATAEPQTIAIQAVSRSLPRGDLPSSQINLADCIANDTVSLTLALSSGYSSYGLEVWAGVACDIASSRVAPTATCWPVHRSQPRAPLYTVDFKVRDLLSGRTRAGMDTGGADSSDSAACETLSSSSQPQSLKAYALLVDANGVAAASATWQTTYLLANPPPRDINFAESGDGQLLVHFSSNPLPATALTVQLFCDPPPNDPQAVANVGPEPVCSEQTELIGGRPAASLQHLRCGSASISDDSAFVDGLVNDVVYNVAAATVDTFGNLGPLSLPVCGVPREGADPKPAGETPTAQKPAEDASASACSFAGTGAAKRASALAACVALGVALGRRRRRG